MFLSLNSLTEATHIRSSAWLEHAPFAFWLMENLAPKTVVELGTHNGFSFLTFCQAVKQMQSETKIFAIDTWQGDEHAGFYSSEVFNALEDELQRFYPGIGLMIKSTFDEARPQFAKGTIDLLHIDGRHRYEDVVHDFQTWRETMSDNGVILFHDTRVQHADFGVWKFWSEIENNFPTFEFFHGHGLGVLAIGKKAPQKVLDLCKAGFKEKSIVRETYARLGSINSMEWSSQLANAEHQNIIQELTDKASYLDTQNKSISNQIEENKIIHNRIQEELAQRNSELSSQAEKAQETIAMLKMDFDYQLNRNTSMLKSRSWRLTAPYRYFGRTIKYTTRKLFNR